MAGCASSEQPLLEQFFAASRLRDTTALQAVATVTFEPLQQGIVRTFRVAGVTPERRSGNTGTKDVTVDARVVLPDGRAVQKIFVITMRRDNGTARAGRWMVTAVK